MVTDMTPEEALLFLQGFVSKVHNMDFIADEEMDRAQRALEALKGAL